MELKLNRNPVTRLLAALTALVMLYGGALAEMIDTWEPEPDIQEYELIQTIALAIVFSDGRAQCAVNVALRKNEKGSAVMKFYRREGAGWKFVGDWSATSTAGDSINSTRSFQAEKGCTYKLVAVVTTTKETQSSKKEATY